MTAQDWSPGRYAAHAPFVSDLGAPVVDLLAPRPGERILDLGCGDGALTLALVRADVVAVDGSPAMVAAARSSGIDAHVADGHRLPFDAEFDAVFSNAALHWMTRPTEVVAGVWRALRPGGRFVGEMGGSGNVATIVAALERARLLAELVEALRPALADAEGRWYADYVRLRFHAAKPADR